MAEYLNISIDTERSEISQYAKSMVDMYDSCKDPVIRAKIRDDIKKFIIEYVEEMDLNNINKFKQIIGDKSPEDLIIVDKKLSRSEKIKLSLLKSLEEMEEKGKLSKLMKFYHHYKNWGNGTFAIHIMDYMFKNLDSYKGIDNSIGSKFLLTALKDLEDIELDNTELNITREKLILKILSRDNVSDTNQAELFSKLKQCYSTLDRIKLYNEFYSKSRMLSLQILEVIVKNYTRKDLATEETLSFLSSFIQNTEAYNNLGAEYIETYGELVSRITDRPEIIDFMSRETMPKTPNR